MKLFTEPGSILKRLSSMSGYTPVFVFGFLLVVLFISVRLSGREPVVEAISPRVASPGEILQIKGHGFGKKSEADVSIAGIVPTSSSYLEWTDTHIAVRVPEDTSAGLVYVTNGYGRSNGMLFSNRSFIPVVVSGPARPGMPYVESVEPARGGPGTSVTLRGMNFGADRTENKVYFTWISSEQSESQGQNSMAGFLACSEDDFDYESWSDREIRIRVPTGAVSGNILIRTDRGDSNTAYFEVPDDVGTRIYTDKITYAIQNTVDIRSVTASVGNSLYLWVPHILESPGQREIQAVTREPVPLFENIQGSSLYHLAELQTGGQYRVFQSFLVDRYAEENRIRASEVKKYDGSRQLYKVYTAPDSVIPSGHPDLVKTAKTIAGKEKNPVQAAKLTYDYLLTNLEPGSSGAGQNVVQVLKAKKASAGEYALLFTALLRATGIPSRTINGYLVDEGLSTIPHVWAEFYLEGYGWIPADPFLGDVRSYGRFIPVSDVPDFYFGNIDNRHIELSRGFHEGRAMDQKGKRIRKEKPFGFQPFHEEAVGNLAGYTSSWSEYAILGVY